MLIVFALGMLSTVRFDDQTMLDTSEVENERAEWMLTAKFITLQPSPAQHCPQPTLGIGHGGPELARRSIGHGNKYRAPSPSQPLRAGPLPLPRSREREAFYSAALATGVGAVRSAVFFTAS